MSDLSANVVGNGYTVSRLLIMCSGTVNVLAKKGTISCIGRVTLEDYATFCQRTLIHHSSV